MKYACETPERNIQRVTSVDQGCRNKNEQSGDFMKSAAMKILRFLWRTSRNAVCAVPGGAGLLYPATSLSAQFGRGDAVYAWAVFFHHYKQLSEAGFTSAQRVLEIGPGRNIGTALLWWAHLSSKSPGPEIVCWDVFPNANLDEPGYWSSLALALGEAIPADMDSALVASLTKRLEDVAGGRAIPSICYRVESIDKLEADHGRKGASFDLVYSHAAIEHVWSIETFWDTQVRLTAPDGWHSHRIDMADHGKRETNYVELLEWSRTAYWLMLRFVPGATNRWRACHYLAKLEALGFVILVKRRLLEASLPIPLARISPDFRGLADEDLRAVALDVVARGPAS